MLLGRFLMRNNPVKHEKDKNGLIIEKKKYHPALIIFPSFCDVIATILDTTGLIYVLSTFIIISKIRNRLMYRFIKC